MSVVMPTSADVATRHSAARNCSQNPCLPPASTTAALTELTLQTTSYLSLQTWACPIATYFARCVKMLDANATTLPAIASSSPRTRTKSKRYVSSVKRCSFAAYANIPNRSRTKTSGTLASSIPFCTPTSTSSAVSCSEISVLLVMAIWALMGLARDLTRLGRNCAYFLNQRGRFYGLLVDWYMTSMGNVECVCRRLPLKCDRNRGQKDQQPATRFAVHSVPSCVLETCYSGMCTRGIDLPARKCSEWHRDQKSPMDISGISNLRNEEFSLQHLL